MPNRLAGETSPYLLQHKDNPVDWYPWGEEARAKAIAEDKPIFLSIGYSSCHWCHVMEHESFESAEVANRLNDAFVSIKVDREERPDLDDAYMVAVQLSSGRGGWPMSVFLTPEGAPFFAGTYFPKLPREGHPGFLEILDQIAERWKVDRAKVLEVAAQFDAAMRANADRESPPATLTWPELMDNCVRSLSLDFDEDHGGFGKAPKFPPHTAIEFLLEYAVSDFGTEELRQTAADQALFTLEAMALGGLHDHVGGGFHRYSTDERWLVPHFEKMLYDNALMLGNYARAAALCEEQLPTLEGLYARTAEAIVRWIRDEMVSPEGLFYSALDADSEGEEGKYYTWSVQEVERILGPTAKPFMDAFQFHREGNFRDEATGKIMGVNIPHLLEIPNIGFDQELQRLRAERGKRTGPALDHKAIVAWNGLMIGALAQVAEIELAEVAAAALLEFEQKHGELPHQISNGHPSGKAFLDDYAYLVAGLMALSDVKKVFEEEGISAGGRTSSGWLAEATRLATEMKSRFEVSSGGGFYSTSADHEELFGRIQPIFDQPMPSANAVAARCLIELGDLDAAKRAIESVGGWIERAPAATEAHCMAILKLLERKGPIELPASSASPAKQAKVVVSVDRDRLMAINEVGEAILRIEIPEGLHINSPNPPVAWLVPTTVDVEPLGYRVHFPETEDDRYTGLVEIPFEVDIPEGVASTEIEVTVRFQACSETECQLPEEWRWQGYVQAT